MTVAWAALDDGYHSHPKTAISGRGGDAEVCLMGVGLHAKAIAYCAHYLTDGWVPDSWVDAQTFSLRPVRRQKVLQFCSSRALLVPCDGGYRLPDYLDYNPSKEAVLQRRRANGGRRNEGDPSPPVTRRLARADARGGEGSTSKEAITEIYDYWRATCGHPNAKLGDRGAKVAARLREGYSVEFIKEAIARAAQFAFVDTRGVRRDDLELICRNASKLEDFHQRGQGNQPPTRIDKDAERRARAVADRAAIARTVAARNGGVVA